MNNGQLHKDPSRKQLNTHDIIQIPINQSKDNSSNLNILIVEDDPDMRSILNMGLSNAGFVCELAGSIKEALFKLANTEPDLILLDLNMNSDINGLDILLQIRTNPRLEGASVIILTGYPEMVETGAISAELILYKPVDIDQLVGLVKRFGHYRSQKKYKFYQDPLTGAYNRDFLISRLDHAMHHARRRHDFLFATLMIYPMLVDNSGKQLDQYLQQQIVRRLNHRLRLTDTVAYHGSNTFCTLLEDIKHAKNTQIVIDRITNNLSHPYNWLGQTIFLVIYLGAVVFDQRYKMPSDILKTTEETLEAARSTGENNQLIVPAYGQPAVENFE